MALEIQQVGKTTFRVPSESTADVHYTVDLGRKTCTCPVGKRGKPCKHLRWAQEYVVAQKAGTLQPNGGLGLPAGADPERADGEKTIKGYVFGEVASALQKEIRHGDVEAAVYWGLVLYGAAPYYAWKRVAVTACEDIGFGSPETVFQVGILYEMWRGAKEGSWYVSPHAFTFAIVLLCRAQKSTEIEDLQSYTQELIRQGYRREMPGYAIDAHTKAGKARGATWADWYRDRHVTFGIPVNAWTRKLWALTPAWKPPDVE